MNVSYLVPLQRSWARARRMLLSPFRLETWLVLGFAAFLSEWLSGGWGVTSRYHLRREHAHANLDQLGRLFAHPFWGPLLTALVILAVLAALVFQWLGARGKFVFLDGVVRGRAAIAEPWERYARQGNSLFLWKLVFWLVAGAVIAGTLFSVAGAALLAWLGFRQPVALAPPILGGLALLGFLGLALAFTMLVLDDFVVPLMYRHGLTTNQAWRRFLPLFGRHAGAFVLYGLFILALVMVVVTVVTAVGFATCCVGFVLMGLPYVGQVVLLPLYVAFRGLGPEFLAQFGSDFDAFAAGPGPGDAQADVAPAPGPGAPA